LFVDCRLVREDSTLPAASVRLGRPWHPQADPRISGSAVFIRCYMDDHIGPIGYAKISSTDSIGQRIWFDLEPDSRFFEYTSHGPGAVVSPQRPTLDEKAAAWYTPHTCSTAGFLEIGAPFGSFDHLILRRPLRVGRCAGSGLDAARAC
jgi:pectinesterase